MRKLKTVASLLLAVVITGLSAITPAFADYDPGFDVDAEAVYFINLDTGKVIYEKDADKKVYPASTTKIMTALLALENIPDLDTPQIELKLYIQNALSGTGASLAGILRGETFTPRELLYAALLPSEAGDASGLSFYAALGILVAVAIWILVDRRLVISVTAAVFGFGTASLWLDAGYSALALTCRRSGRLPPCGM